MASNEKVTEYRPVSICRNVESNAAFALIILNQPLDHYQGLILNMWKRSYYKLMCDGGANRFIKFLRELNLNPDDFLPDIVTGDFDSIYKDTLAFYKNKCKIIHTPDQELTDFTKAFHLVMKEMNERKIKLDHVIAITNTKGRFDHILGNIQTLYEVQKFSDIPVYLLAEKSLTWLLAKGKHRIIVDEELMEFTCGLLPIGEPCIVTTTGLKWNLDGHVLQFGGLVSTSNTYSEKIVTIETDKPIVWTMEIRPES